MAHSLSAKKRVRQSLKRREHNRAIKSQFRNQIRKVLKLVSTKGEGLDKEFRTLVGYLDKAASKKVIHKNTAARYKARLSARVAAAGKK